MPLENGTSPQPRQTVSVVAESLVVLDHVRPHYDKLWPDLYRFYNETGRPLPDPELLIAIDNTFWPQLQVDVCEPLGFFQAACSFVALVLLRQADLGGA